MPTIRYAETVLTTRGDLIVHNGVDTMIRLPLGTSGQVLTSDGLDVVWQDPAPLSAPVVTGGMTLRGDLLLQNTSGTQPSLQLSEDPDNGTNKITIKAPASLASDYTFELPAVLGSEGQVLAVAAGGELEWITAGGGAEAPLTLTGSTDAVQLKVVANATQTSDIFQILASDGTTQLLDFTSAGALSVYNSSGAGGTVVVPASTTVAGYVQLNEATNNGSNWVRVSAPTAVSGNRTFYLPTTTNITGGLLYSDSTESSTWLSPTTGCILVGASSSSWTSSASATEFFLDRTNDRVGIGTGSPAYKFEVSSSQAASPIARLTHSHATTPNGIHLDFSGGSPDDNSNYFLRCEDSTADRLFIYSDGDIQNHDNSYGAISDERLKENIVDSTPKLQDLMRVRIRHYNFKDDPTKQKQLGVIAQELEDVFPGLVKTHAATEARYVTYEAEPEVTETRSVLDADGNPTAEKETVVLHEAIPERTVLVEEAKPEYKSVQYSVFVPMLIKAIQEQQVQIERLKALLM